VTATVMSGREASIARDARNWSHALLEHMPVRGQAAVKALCQILITAWICEPMIADQPVLNAASTKAGFSATAQQVAALLHDFEGTIEMQGLQPNLVLLTTILLLSEGLQVEPFSQFLDHSVAILRRTDPSSDNAWLLDKRILLHHADILPMSSAPADGGLELPSAAFRLSASPEAVEALANEVERRTGWGTCPVEAIQVTPWLGDLLAGLIAQQLRNYNLRSGARLLRLHQYLVAGGAARDRQDLYDALCMHRQSQGPFGWYGPEASALQRASPDLHGDLEILLPTTLEVLWTLAERSRSWRLFSSVFGCVARGHQHRCALE
jgi:hypothetical protein